MMDSRLDISVGCVAKIRIKKKRVVKGKKAKEKVAQFCRIIYSISSFGSLLKGRTVVHLNCRQQIKARCNFFEELQKVSYSKTITDHWLKDTEIWTAWLVIVMLYELKKRDIWKFHRNERERRQLYNKNVYTSVELCFDFFKVGNEPLVSFRIGGAVRRGMPVAVGPRRDRPDVSEVSVRSAYLTRLANGELRSESASCSVGLILRFHLPLFCASTFSAGMKRQDQTRYCKARHCF